MAAATLASQSEQFGHRRLAFVCSFLYPSAVYGLSALAVSAHSLPLFAASYAFLGGLGFFCGYPQLPPFLASTWFPDRRGLVVPTQAPHSATQAPHSATQAPHSATHCLPLAQAALASRSLGSAGLRRTLLPEPATRLPAQPAWAPP